MMTVTFVRSRAGELYKFIAQGHTGYADHGSDIVCAAASSVILSTLNGLTDVVGLTVGYEVAEGYTECVLPAELSEKQADGARVLLESLVLAVRSLERQYHGYITVEEVEV